MEKLVGAKFGDAKNPLLVSVRSGARASMPGMMDTILNLGLNDKTAAGAGREVGQRALRLRQLPPLRRDVRRRRARAEAGEQGRSRSVRGDPRGQEEGARREAGLRPAGRRAQGAGRRVQGRDQEPARRRLPGRSVRAARRARSRRCSSRGRTTAPSSTAGSTTSRSSGARPSTSRRWCSATWATTRRPASASRATRPAARTCSTASS